MENNRSHLHQAQIFPNPAGCVGRTAQTTPAPSDERPLRELRRQPKATTSRLRSKPFGSGLHHSARGRTGLCSTFSFYGAGTAFQQRGMQEPGRKALMRPPPPEGPHGQLHNIRSILLEFRIKSLSSQTDSGYLLK